MKEKLDLQKCKSFFGLSKFIINGTYTFIKNCIFISMKVKYSQEEVTQLLIDGNHNEVATNSIGLVKSIALRLVELDTVKLDLDSLISAGYLGLTKALTSFDPYNEYNSTFATYASKVIKHQMISSIETESNTIRIPSRPNNVLNKGRITDIDDVYKIAHRYTSEQEYDEPTIDPFKLLLKHLKQSDVDLLRYKFKDGLSYQEMTDNYGTSRQNLQIKMDRILKTIQNNEELMKILKTITR